MGSFNTVFVAAEPGSVMLVHDITPTLTGDRTDGSRSVFAYVDGNLVRINSSFEKSCLRMFASAFEQSCSFDDIAGHLFLNPAHYCVPIKFPPSKLFSLLFITSRSCFSFYIFYCTILKSNCDLSIFLSNDINSLFCNIEGKVIISFIDFKIKSPSY